MVPKFKGGWFVRRSIVHRVYGALGRKGRTGWCRTLPSREGARSRHIEEIGTNGLLPRFRIKSEDDQRADRPDSGDSLTRGPTVKSCTPTPQVTKRLTNHPFKTSRGILWQKCSFPITRERRQHLTADAETGSRSTRNAGKTTTESSTITLVSEKSIF